MLARWSRDIKYTLNLASQLRYARMSAALYNKRVYTDTDEWIHHTNGGEAQIGITANAVEQLNEVVYIEYQLEPGDKAEKGDDLVLIESVKATEAIQAPFNMVLVENNQSLEESLDALNEKPEETWLIKVERKDDLFTL
tara:strand:- start:197 stop:613 length:417 start_codon:yes stop_codon:yes gene_type:complete